eukprot:98855_1
MMNLISDNELKLDTDDRLKILLVIHGLNSDKNKILIAGSGGAKALLGMHGLNSDKNKILIAGSGGAKALLGMHGLNSDKNKILIARSGGAKATYNDSILITALVYNNDIKILYCIGFGNTIKIMSNGEILDIYENII